MANELYTDDIEFWLFVITDAEKESRFPDPECEDWLLKSAECGVSDVGDGVTIIFENKKTEQEKKYELRIVEILEPEHPDVIELKKAIKIIEEMDPVGDKEDWHRIAEYMEITLKDKNWWVSNTTTEAISTMVDKLDKWVAMNGDGRRQSPESFRQWALDLLKNTTEKLSKEKWDNGS